ncbi:uncharacterized protein LOC123563026 [Mercenaria mercenaria]|uniref:uncharacterized protein LOC123563026 n=1 Tax=Mercenaria mercenaria TaxID=6596 RepID=UPI00234F5C3B|nr:uncharacterized protein LOC123563026 [Mercenaria mercenaria]
MRHLHPFCQSAGDSELLDSRNRVWRLAAKKAMHFKGTASSWGGHFKEAIVVSCLSRRCYTLVRSIITTRRTMFMKVTGFLFRGFCGCKDEGLMYALLKRWDQGDISSNDVNERLKEEKASSRPVTEVETLKTENARLEAMVSQLQAEVRT